MFVSYHMVFCPNLKILVLVLSWKTDELQSRTIELPFFAWSLLELPMYFRNNFVIIPLAEILKNTGEWSRTNEQNRKRKHIKNSTVKQRNSNKNSLTRLWLTKGVSFKYFICYILLIYIILI